MRTFQKIKKNLFSFFLKKEVIFLFLALILFLFPLKATAQFGTVIGAFTFTGSIFGLAILAFFVIVTKILALIAGLVLDAVIGPHFISVSYTNPATNPIIGMGLNITQGLVNIFLVAALIYTALSIALRLANEAQAKKMLIRLIFVALIVNFAPVICGLIVDASNIVMNYFLTGIKEGVSGSILKGTILEESLAKNLLRLTSFEGQIILLTKSFMQIIINLVIFFIFLLFAAIFLFRYLAIWISVILAPWAFVAWVFPPGKIRKIWDMWWNNFLEWSIIGIPMAFFLWLGLGLFNRYNELFKEKLALPGLESEIAEFFNQIFVYFVVASFLLLGSILGLQSSAMGAQAIISGTKTGLKKTRQWMGRTAISGIRGIKPISQAEEAIMKGLERTPVIGRMVGGPGAYEKAKARELGEARKEMESIPDDDLRRLILRPAVTRRDRFRRAAALELLAKRGKFYHETREREMAGFIPEAQALGIDVSAIYKARPDLAGNIIIPDPKTGRKRPMTTEEAMDKIPPGEFWRLAQNHALKDKTVAYLTAKDNRKFEQFSRHASPEKKRVLKNTWETTPWPANLKPEIEKLLNSIANDPRWQV